MIDVFGPVLIIAGCVFAGAASLLRLIDWNGSNTAGPRAHVRGWANWASIGALVAFGGAVALLAVAHVTSNVELEYVANNVRADAPALYRLSGVWAGMDGSLLVWAAGFAALAWALGRYPTRFSARVGGPASAGSAATRPGGAAAWLLSGLAAAYGALDVMLANPFRLSTAPVPVGVGMAPILEHPAMLIHPPLVYAGLITAIAVAAWSPTSSGWRRALWSAWAILLLGMCLGAVWSYTEAGWGGFWAWDPVENVSLIPWLCLTGGLHSRATTARWWTGAGAALALLGVVVTRSGATASIHAFAKDSQVGWGVAAVALAGVVAVLWIARAETRRDSAAATVAAEKPVGRAQTIAMAVVGAATFVITVGTLRPLVDTLGGGSGVIVTPTYYVRLLGPIAAVALSALLAVSCWRATRSGPQQQRQHAAKTLLAAVPIGAISATALGAWAGAGSAITLVGLALNGAAAAASFVAWRHGRFGSFAAAGHIGLCVMLAGVAGVASTRSEALTMSVGDTATLAGANYRLRTLGLDADDRTSTITATVKSIGDGHQFSPRLVSVPARSTVLAEVDVAPGLVDTHVALRRATDDQRALIEVTRVPLAFLLWIGAALLLGTAGAALLQGSAGAALLLGTRAAALARQQRSDRSVGP